MFRVVTPATDLQLLSIEELRAAAGVTGEGEDGALTALGLRIASLFAHECGVEVDGIKPPTLRRETCEDKWRRPSGAVLRLSRRFIDTIDSIVEDGDTLASDQYEVDKAAGLISRLEANRRRAWRCDLVITYKAGFEAVPEDLKYAAGQAVREARAESSANPLLRAETIDDVGRFEYQIGGLGRDKGSALSPSVLAALQPYRTEDAI